MTTRAIPTIDVFPLTLDGRKVGHVDTLRAGERDEWELHPDQDELLYLVYGETDVLLRTDPRDASSQKVIPLQGGEACIVPRGAWHRQVVKQPSRLLFLSPPSVRQPYTPDDGWD